MTALAPVRIPVEIRRVGAPERWFRMAAWLAADELQLFAPLPDEVDGPVEIRFVLPGATEPITAVGRIGELRSGEGADERAERRALLLHTLGERERGAIAGYVEERLREP